MSLCDWFNTIINPHPMQLEMSSHISKSNRILFKEIAAILLVYMIL